jgi:DNA-binding response OmpR family regulator
VGWNIKPTAQLAPAASVRAILEYLMRNVDCPVTRDKLLDHVWGGNFQGLTNIVDVYINYLRRKLDPDFENRLIHTVRGTGYMVSSSIPRRESRPALRTHCLGKKEC